MGYFFLYIIFLFFKLISSAELEYDGMLSIKLEHALDTSPEGEFSNRGVISIHSVRTGAISSQQIQLPLEHRQALKEIAQEDGNYRLKAIVKGADGKENEFLTFIKACCLLESNLSDSLTVSLDQSGSVIGISMSCTVICEGKSIPDDDIKNFNTAVFVSHMENGPIPDTAIYIQKMERERDARERGGEKDNRWFLQKYWMYIIPAAIFLLLSGATNPEGPAQGGGGGGGR